MVTKTLTKEQIIESISNMTVIELSELIKALEEKFGIQATSFMPTTTGVVQQTAAVSSPAAVEEKTEFSVILTNAGQNKIPVIKLVREITGLGLKEAKELVDTVPKPIKESIPKEQAEELRKKFQELGATIELK